MQQDLRGTQTFLFSDIEGSTALWEREWQDSILDACLRRVQTEFEPQTLEAFLAGTHWSFQLQDAAKTPFNLFVTSNAVFLVAWFAFVIADLRWALLTEVLAFLYLLYVDFRLRQADLTAASYFRVRSIATSLACLSLLIIAFSL